MLLKNHMFFFICVILSLYFGYHVLQGERGILSNMSLNREIETLSQMKTSLEAERAALEKKVVMMRPGSVDKDLLEEQVRSTLGYRYSSEVTVLSH